MKTCAEFRKAIFLQTLDQATAEQADGLRRHLETCTLDYRAATLQSIDALDALVTRESLRRVPEAPVYTASFLEAAQMLD